MKNTQSLRVETSLGPQASATTARTAAIDAQGASFVTITVPISAEANTNSTNVIIDTLHSDDTVVTNHTSLGTFLADNTAAHTAVINVNMVGKKRYLRVTATPDTTTNGAVLIGGIVALKTVDLTPTASTTSTLTNY